MADSSMTPGDEFNELRRTVKELLQRSSGKKREPEEDLFALIDRLEERYLEMESENDQLKASGERRTTPSEVNEAAPEAGEVPRDYYRFSRQIIENAREGIIVYDTDLRYRLWNPYMATITGKHAEEVLGKHPQEVFPFLRETGMMEQLQRVLEEGEQLQRSFPYELPETGISGWASDLSAPLRNVKGEIIGIVGLIREITRRKEREDRIRESEEKFRLLVQALQEGIWTIDRDGYTTMVNPKMAEMLGYEVEEMAGVSVFSVIAPDSLEQAEKRIARGRNGIDDKFEINLQKKNGDTITALLGTSPLFDEEGRYNGSLGAVMDISDLKKARKELEEEKERAEESDRLKSAFLANMSHEIRTPLNAIIGFIDVVLLDVSLSHDVKESLENAKRSGNDLMRLMDDILDLAKLETGQVTPEIVPFSPATVLDNATEKAKSLIGGSRKDIELTARVEKAEDIILRSDPKRLEQVLIYLIENAVKFTVAGNIEIGISAQEQEGTEIYVRDTGIGIPVEAQPHIFSPFRQADERVNREFSGLGLGLTIAHKLTALLGGTVRFESVPGEGTVFYVFLPYTEDNREGT